MRAAFLLPLLALIALPMQASGDDAVKVYRCTDARGHVTLGDTPCAQGSREQVLNMQRPQDAPPPTGQAATPSPAPVATPAHTTVNLRAPQPMYECVTPDGERYTSETGDGNPRWVPLWTMGYRTGHGQRPSRRTSGSALADYYDHLPLGGRAGAPTPMPSNDTGSARPRPPRHAPLHAIGAGTWVRDTCHALPQAEVCARLRDRREVIRRRFFNAQEIERNSLRTEERSINHRLDADCGRP